MSQRWEATAVYLRRPSEELARRWALLQQTLLQARAVSRAAGARLVLLSCPDRVQVDDEFRRQLFAAFKGKPDRYDFERPHRLLAAFAAEHEIAYLDLAPAFRGGDAESLYLVRDPHWNADGHRLAAEAIAAYLRETIPALGRRDS
jgi:hypothetical protein